FLVLLTSILFAVLIHEKVPFINADQLLNLYYINYLSKFDLDNFARSSDETLSGFLRTTWPQSFKITTCPNNNSEWISLIHPIIVQDGSFDDTFSAEQILRKMRYLVPNRTVLYPCCLELLYKESYKGSVEITSTGYQSFSELMHNSIIW